MRFLIAALLVIFVAPAAAQQSPGSQRIVLRASNGGDVIVWRDGRSMREGMQMIDAGVHRSRPQLLMPLISCITPSGTAIIVTNGGFATSTITVIDGRSGGCRGDVDNVYIIRGAR